MNGTMTPAISEQTYFPYGWPRVNHESPETAIARSNPLSALRLLERMSVRSHYEKVTSIGASVASAYINRLGGEGLSHLDSIEVTPTRSFSGLVIKFNKRRT